MAQLNERGHEVLDDTPVAIPMRAIRRPSTLDEIRQYIGIVNREAEQQGQESFEEADDFDVGDDYDPHSPWELQQDQEANWDEYRRQVALQKHQAEKGRNAGQDEPEPRARVAPSSEDEENRSSKKKDSSMKKGEGADPPEGG